MEKSFARLMADAEVGIRGKMFNWRRDKDKRHDAREKVIYNVFERYCERYLPAVAALEETPVVRPDGPENIFSIWFQGEQMINRMYK